jgi:Cu2+-exporting ATPase
MAAEGAASVDLMVPGIRCAGCMRAIETGLGKLDGVASARVNLSMRRVRVLYDPAKGSVDAVLEGLSGLGYQARPYDAQAMTEIDRDSAGRDLLVRLAVAGFAAMNVMLLSVSVWSGAEAATRDMLHWISALIALPAIAFSGVPFFRSALEALAARRLNMDVPISLAVCLAAGTSLAETIHGGEHAYFDAGISLIFFLLIGRYLDHRTRAVARSAAAELTALSARAATVIGPDGARGTVAIGDLGPGALVEVAPGERVPADGRIEAGASDLDRSMVTGETNPEPVGPGTEVHAGMLNLSGPLRVRVAATGEATLLAEIARMVDSAERGKTRYDRWADRAARIYAPGVHIVCRGGVYRLALGHRRLAAGRDHRHGAVDHHLPLRAGACGSRSPCGGRGAAVPARDIPEGRRGAGAAGGHRHGGLRQDRHPDRGPPGAGLRPL